MVERLIYSLLVLVSVSLFFHGFFPISKTNDTVVNVPPTHINNINLKKQDVYTSKFDKAVLIVIDALRFDFVNQDFMPLTSDLHQKNGCISRVKVEAPTVTLPRIKALMAGNIPQFIDIVLNLVNTDILQDSLIHSAYQNGKKLVFYGDDTWIKLFPNHFIRYESTTSFFVKDFKEVDDNVTRNLNMELDNDDWDIMILHYLGLDHIGHVHGPFSSLIPEKLIEMDEIINKIYEKMSGSKTLLVVTGDHGMRDSGGHGGSTYAETNVPFLLMGLQCDDSSFPQTDIPVNLAILLGLNIPSSTIGKAQKSILPLNLEEYLYVLRYNSLLLKQKSTACNNHFELATALHETYLLNSSAEIGWRASELYDNCSELIRNNLIKSSVEQTLSSLIIAMLVLFNVLTMLVFKIFSKNTLDKVGAVKVLYFFVSIAMGFCSISASVLFIVISILFVVLLTNLNLLKKIHLKFVNPIAFFFIISTIIHPFTFISSSFIEEEHQFWYFLNILFIILITMKSKNSFNDVMYCFGLLVAFRFLRTLNSTGDKWANYPDFSDWLIENENKYMYQLFSLFGFIVTFYAQYKLVDENNFGIHSLNFIIMLLVFILKIYESNILCKIIWSLLLLHAIFVNASKIILWTLISALLLKPYNVILIPYCIFSSVFFSKHLKRPESIVLYHIWLGNMLYFAQGHSNSFASVDISVGYVGLDEYKPILVIAQVICHTYTFQVLSIFLILKNGIDELMMWDILFSSRIYIYVFICLITCIFRNHLFIWSVFAPKLFIESVHVLFLCIEFILYIVYNTISKWLHIQIENIYRKV